MVLTFLGRVPALADGVSSQFFHDELKVNSEAGQTVSFKDDSFGFTVTKAPITISWERSSNGLPVLSGSIHSTLRTNDALYAAAGAAGMYKSDDDGKHWQQINSGLSDVYVLSVSSNSIESVVYAGAVSKGIYKSTDKGLHWKMANNGLPKNATIDALTRDTKAMYAAVQSFEGNGIYKSSDNGDFWKKISNGLREGTTIFSLQLDNESKNLYAAGVSDDVPALYRSNDSGNHWQRIDFDFPQSNYINCTLSDNDVLYAGTHHGIFISYDNGQHWSQDSKGLVDESIESLLEVNGVMYAGTEHDIYTSIDYGSSWYRLNENLSSGIFNSIFENKGILYTSAAFEGIYKSVARKNERLCFHKLLVGVY